MSDDGASRTRRHPASQVVIMSAMRLVLLFGLCSFPLFAQQQSAPQPLASNVDVKVINVDVQVRNGNEVVSNLTADDFEVFEDGQPQKITNFTHVTAEHSGSAGESALPDARQFRRRTLILIDNNYLEKRDRDVAIAKLDAFVDSSESDSEWGVGTIGQQLDIILPMTDDRAAVHAALAKARKLAVTSLRATDDDREILSDPFRRNRSDIDFDSTAQFEGRERSTRNARSLGYLANALGDGAHAASQKDEGKKFLLVVTGNIEMNSGFANFEKASDREMQDIKTRIGKLIDGVIQEANSENITVFVLNAASHSSAVPQHDVQNQSFGGGSDLNTAAAVDVSEVDSAGSRIALGTGGLYLRSNYVESALQKVRERTSEYYSLGYSPSHPDDRKYHRITVRVKKPGLNVTHREGYVDLSPEERLEQRLRLRISAVQPARDLPVTLRVTPDAAKPQPTLAISAAAPFNTLTVLPSDKGYSGRVHIYLSIFDKSGKNVGFHHMLQNVIVPASAYAKAMTDAFRYDMNIKMGHGVYTIAVTMRDELSRQVGTAVQNVNL